MADVRDKASDHETRGPRLGRWLLWTLAWEVLVAVLAAGLFVIYAMVLDREYAADGIYSADSFYAAQDVMFPLWVVAALVTPFVVYTKLERPRTDT